MKKVILSLAFVTTVLAYSNSKQKDEVKKDVIEEFGCARDCVDYTLETIQPFLEEGGANESYELYVYGVIYESCYARECS